MVIEATCMDCGQTFRYNRIRKPKEPMKHCPKCARKHYASKYLAKHRVVRSKGGIHLILLEEH